MPLCRQTVGAACWYRSSFAFVRSVDLSVCPTVRPLVATVNSGKTAEWIEMLFGGGRGVGSPGGSKERCIRWGQDPPVIFMGTIGRCGAAQCNIQGDCDVGRAKTVELIDLSFRTVSGVGAGNRVLDWVQIQHGKVEIWWIFGVH